LLRQEKVTKKKPTPVCRPLRGYPALLDWSGGCGTRASCSDSPRRNPLTSLRYSAAHRGRRNKNHREGTSCPRGLINQQTANRTICAPHPLNFLWSKKFSVGL
jgi:hypothetical protein